LANNPQSDCKEQCFYKTYLLPNLVLLFFHPASAIKPTFLYLTKSKYQSVLFLLHHSYNNALGKALSSNTSGIENVGVGYLALNANATHDGSTAVGTRALEGATARFNTAIGYWAMRLTTSGEINTGVGYTALYNNSTGNYNTAIGWGAGSFNTTGSQQIFIDAVPRTNYSTNQTETPIYVQVSNSSYLTTQKVTLNGKVGVNTITPHASATLDISSTTQGFLPPRMTGTQAEAISSPAEGLMVYSTEGSGSTITTKGWWGFDGTNWVKLN